MSSDSNPQDYGARRRPMMDTPCAAKYCHLGKSTMDKRRLMGGGPRYIKLGKRVLYDPDDLDSWLAQHKRANTTSV